MLKGKKKKKREKFKLKEQSNHQNQTQIWHSLGPSLRGATTHLLVLPPGTPTGPHGKDMRKKPSYFRQEEGNLIILKYGLDGLCNKNLLSKGKDFIGDVSDLEERLLPNAKHPSLSFSPKGRKRLRNACEGHSSSTETD